MRLQRAKGEFVKAKELQESLARYGVAHRAVFEALNGIAEQYPDGQGDAEIVEAFQQVRVNLMTASHWQQYLGRILMTKTEEGVEAIKKYREDLEKREAEAKAQAARDQRNGEQNSAHGVGPKLHFVESGGSHGPENE